MKALHLATWFFFAFMAGAARAQVTNDDCSTPIAWSGPGTYVWDNLGATTGAQQSMSCSTCNNDIWYSYVAAQTGTATMTTCGLVTSSYVDTLMAVYDGSGCPTSTSIACDDDANCAVQSTLTSTLTWSTVCGQTYMIQLGQFGSGSTGLITASVMITETGGACGPVHQPYCFGDGTGTPCPCGNNGAAGHGCANSANPAGARLATSGGSTISNDTLALLGTGMPNSACLYFQATTQVSLAFGDGLRCAGGTVTRLGAQINAGGASQYPAAGDAPVHIAGGVLAAGTRTYQAWYRNVAPYCTPSPFNLSNGMSVPWQ
jgi:hypothetical protein